MDFGSFLGNDALKARLTSSFRQGKSSHCYLLCGPEGSGRHTLARQMAAALECGRENDPGCGVCPGCRKAKTGQHPDIILVDDREHKTVSVDTIRQMCADVFIRPNEGRKKVYILPRGQDLGPAAQNALLKILEEPPSYAVFLILTTSAEKLLPTIRSRAVQLQLAPLSASQALGALKARFPAQSEDALAQALERTEGYLGPAFHLLEQGMFQPQTLALANAFAAKDTLGILQTLVPMEKYPREKLSSLLGEFRQLLCMALRARAGAIVPDETMQALLRRRTGTELLQAAQTAAQAQDDLAANIGVGAVIGGLCISLR